MKPEYQEWIDKNVTAETAFAKCAEWTASMQAYYPELNRVRGHVFLSSGIERSHWWLTDEGGAVIDPTVSQFRLDYFGGAKPIHYEPWDETQPEPTGKCPNCGGLCYNGDTCCSDRCAASYAAYCNNPFGNL